MSTNGQTHTDFIWSIQTDGPAVLISIAMLALVVALVVVLLRRRRKV
jgi:MYXO-CTERM domain-containing protein